MADEERTPAKSGGIWGFIKEHAAIIGGAVVGVIALYYLVFMQQSSSAPSSVSFPPQGGGSASGAPSTTPTTTPPPITLPFNPDFNILNAITDSALKALYQSEYNIELQINAAVQAGTDTSSLYSQLSAIQQQIAGYIPAGGNPIVILNTITASQQNAWANAYFSGPQTLSAWITAAGTYAPSVTQTFNYAQLTSIYNFFNTAAGKAWVASQGGGLNAINYFLTNPGSVASITAGTPITGGGTVTLPSGTTTAALPLAIGAGANIVAPPGAAPSYSTGSLPPTAVTANLVKGR